MPASLVDQITEVVDAPGPFVLIALACAGAIWRIFKWRYDTIIEGLQHRLSLRDDTIKRYETDGVPKVLQIDQSTTPLANGLSHKGPLSAEKQLGSAPTADSTASAHSSAEANGSVKLYISGSVTAVDLRGVYSGRTDIQAERQAAIYVNKWMNIAGKVRAVHAIDETRTRLRLADDDSDSIGLRGCWLSFNSDREVLETLKIDDYVHATGKIERFNQYDINLVDCELLKAE